MGRTAFTTILPDVAVDAPERGINAIGAIRFRDVQEDTFD